MRRTTLRKKSSKKKFSASWFRAKLDEACKANIRSIGRCEAEGMFGIECSSQLHAHHISRCRHYVNRWYEGNLVCLCAKHHMHLHDHAKDEIELVNKLWEGATYEIDGNTFSHYDYLMWREHNEPFARNYEDLLEYWRNKPARS